MGVAASDRSLTVDGNKLTVIGQGPMLFETLMALIDGARRSLRLLYYTYSPDNSGEAVRAALSRAVERGVKVSLLIDGFGSSHLPDNYFKALREAGAGFCRFNPSFGRRYVLRNHQKLALADGETKAPRILIGGFNVDDDYFATVEQGGWRDVGLLIEGPAAARPVAYYDALMEWEMRPRSRLRTLRAMVRKHSETKGKLRWQYGGPMQMKSPWALAMIHDLNHANDLEMIAAYFAPMGGMIRRIGDIASRGRVRIITAAKSDNRATIDAARSTYTRLFRRGVQVFEYEATKLHSKLLIMDDVVHIGSSNFDIRSLYLNMEMMLRIEDPEFAMLMRSHFEHEICDSREITWDVHRARGGWLQRLRWKLAWFLVASLDYTVARGLALKAP
ncbi:MAG TPA: phosphatidylserine/phosphatidylglycerophosphate/cardiolipin synthase family protein [Sphingomicrobium sp.]|nr:phosphatidylserine/phosphatidylglycerophosphate/cardiolipin synthase family protein [Sphingomicrobium sp.]